MPNDWIERIDANTLSFNSTFGSLSKEELNYQPNPKTWSIAQNIDHLVLINSTYFNVFTEAESNSIKLPFYGNFGFISSFFGNLILKAVESERKKKGKTFNAWEPSESDIPVSILDTFSKSQEDLKLHISNLDEALHKDAIIYTPVSKKIILPLNTAIEIVITHENRHFNQAKEILETLSSSV